MPTKEQRQLMKTMEKLFRQKYAIVAKKHSFKNNSYWAFKVKNDFFFSSFVYLNNLALFDNYLEINVSLQVKPMIVDEFYWEIFGLNENKKKPLSFRANGCFVVQGPTLIEIERETITFKNLIPNEENLIEIIEAGFELIDKEIDTFLKQCTIETFDVNNFRFIGLSNDKALMSMLLPIANGNYQKALDLVKQQLTQSEKGRYYKSDGTSVYDLVKKYCEGKI